MNPVVDKWIDEHTDELVARVRRCIAFPTVLDESTAGPGAPFGRVTAECLEDTLAQGREMGFEAKNLDGYCGYIDFGAGEESLETMLFDEADIPWNDLAFRSVTFCLRAYFDDRRAGRYVLHETTLGL